MKRKLVQGARRQHLTASLVLALLVVSPFAIAKTAHLPFGLPSVERVLQTVHGKSALDTKARQVGVFDQLLNMLANFEGPAQFYINKQTPAEIRLHKDYVSAENRIVDSVQNELRSKKVAAGAEPPGKKWMLARYAYSEDRDYVVRTFLSAQAQHAYSQALRREKASEAEGRAELAYHPAQSQAPALTGPDHTSLNLEIYGAVGLVIALVILSVFGAIGGGGGSSYGGGSGYSGGPGNTPGQSRTTSTSWSSERPLCDSCHGSGKINCPNGQCRNGLLYEGGTSFNKYCFTCHGLGHIVCSSCGGSGRR